MAWRWVRPAVRLIFDVAAYVAPSAYESVVWVFWVRPVTGAPGAVPRRLKKSEYVPASRLMLVRGLVDFAAQWFRAATQEQSQW